MKPILFLLLTTLLFLNSCADNKKVTVSVEESIYLTPEIMCGTVEFTDGCGPKTDTLIRFGLALIHHMTYEDAAYTFDKVIESDPDCFWGHWGKAMTFIHPLWPDVPTEDQMKMGYILSQRAMSLAKKPNEKLYGAVIAAYYEQGTKPKPQRLADTEKAWAAAHEQLPEDPEAELFYDLFRLSTTSPSDKTYRVQNEVNASIEKLWQKYPNHPGVFHYTIHANDAPPLAEKALVAARNYGKIAPEIPHALHMPSHIFTRLGHWTESIDWNARAAKAAEKLSIDGKYSHHVFHSLDYMTYAYLQLGNDEKVNEMLKYFDTISLNSTISPQTAYAVAAIPSRVPMENQRWAEAAAVPVPDSSAFPWEKFRQYEALRYFARGIGGARSNNLDVANDASAQLEKIHTGFGDAPENKYWKDQVNIQRIAVNAWIAFAKGEKEKALALMKESTDLEEATQKNPVSPGELLPARELLGDMYMEMKMPAEALAEYQKSLMSRPNRFNSLYGAGYAAEKLNDPETAKSFYSQLLAMPSESSSKRERALHAQDVVGATQ